MGWVFNIQEIMRSICEGEQNMLTAQVGGKVRGEQQQQGGKTMH